ncbi:hypothetical protein BGY98DRAFT_1004990 [Russula aff. rugulosa BPL654]|nr:hypothetical protein BGY98DRAFT_1004990 [Russula aff. rugulosa BPL654]
MATPDRHWAGFPRNMNKNASINGTKFSPIRRAERAAGKQKFQFFVIFKYSSE